MIAVLLSIPFFLSAISKSIDSGHFVRQVQRLGFLPSSVCGFLCVIILGLVWSIASSLFLGVCHGLILPFTQAFLCCAMLITVLQAWKQQRPSCGCYGPGITVPPAISIIIDLILLIGVHNLEPAPCTHESIRIILVMVIIGLFLGRTSLSSPIIDFSPIARGKKWVQPTKEEISIIAFLSIDCTTCAQWQPVLNALNKHHPVQIITSQCDEDRNKTPCIRWTRKQMLKYVESFPTIILLHHDTIQKKWDSSPPENLLEQIQQVHYSS